MRLHNRQIKATFWNDPDLLQWHRDKRLFYEGLSQLADDSACLENSPFAFKLNLFPSPLDADITVDVIAAWVQELVDEEKLIPYLADKKSYLYMKNFHKHQTLDKPTPPNKASVPLPPWLIWVEVTDKEGRPSRRQSHYEVIGQWPDNGRTSPGRVPVELGTRNLEPEPEPEGYIVGSPPDEPPPDPPAQPEKIPYTGIVDHLNRVCGTGFKGTSKSTRDLIKARWNEGFRLDDFKTVINKKSREWLTDPKQVQYLRPITLFGTKFESYLNQREAEKGGGKPREPTAAGGRNIGASDGVNWNKLFAPGAGPPDM